VAKAKSKSKGRAKVKAPGRSGGLGRVKDASKKIEEKKAARNRRFLKIEDGESVILRVLDVGEDFKDGWVHPVEYEYEDDKGKTQTRTMDVMCLDQDEKGIPCPGCRDDLDRRYKFWTNVIVRDWEDDDGNEADALMIWSGGITVARRLDKMNAKHGLLNRDIEVEREGKKLNTKYDIDWADDEDTSLSKDDQKLAKGKHDLSRYVKIREFDDFYKSPKELYDDEDDDKEVGERSRRRGSAFPARKKDKGKSSARKGTKATGLAGVKAKKDKEGSKKSSSVKMRRKR
jgi:hypothetical protein